MTTEIPAIYDQKSNPRLGRHIGIFTDAPRFLGIFLLHMIPAAAMEKSKAEGKPTPFVGFVDLFRVCRSCPQPHIGLDEIGVFVRFGNALVSIFWPSWLSFI